MIFQLLGIMQLAPELSVSRFSGWWMKDFRAVPKEVIRAPTLILVPGRSRSTVFEKSRPLNLPFWVR